MADDLDFGATVRGYAPGQKVFNRYTLQKMLGRGGMGVVWLASDDELERNVALKFLPEIVALDKQSVQDLKRETRRSLELTHPNIVRIYDFIQDDKAAAISMEFIDGDDLSSRKVDQPNGHFDVVATVKRGVFNLQQHSPLVGWIEQLCDALHYAHTQAEVVHRDLKPHNLMVDAKGKLKIADFGIAASVSDSVSRVSQQAGSSGTPVYMSPQQMMGEPPAVTDDVYSIGATLYELLTGRPPFYSGNVMMQVMNKVPPSLAERRQQLQVQGESIPETWESTIARCLAKEPADRPPSVLAVKEALLRPPRPTGTGAAGDTFKDVFGDTFGGQQGADPNAPKRGEDHKLKVPLLPEEMQAGCTRRIELGATKEKIEVKIPAGVEVGTRIRLRGQGGVGINGGEAGDLYLEVVAGMKASPPPPTSPPASGPPPTPPPSPTGSKDAPAVAPGSKSSEEKKETEDDAAFTPLGIGLFLLFLASLVGWGVVKIGWLDGFDQPTPDTLVMVQGFEGNFTADTGHKSVNGFYRVESAEAKFSVPGGGDAPIRDRSFFEWGDVITVQTNRWTGETTAGDQPVIVRVAVEVPRLSHADALEGMLNLKMALEIPVLSEGTGGKEFTEEVVRWEEVYPVKLKPREGRPFTQWFTQIVLWVMLISFVWGVVRVLVLNGIRSAGVRFVLNVVVFGGFAALAFYRLEAAEEAYLAERERVRALADAEEALAQGDLDAAERLVDNVIAADADNRAAFSLRYKIEDMPRDLRVPADHRTLREALAAARDNDTILIAPGTYEGSSHINKSVRIRGTGETNTEVVLQVSNPGPRETGRNVITVDSGVVATLENLTLQHTGSMVEDTRPSVVLLNNRDSRLTLSSVQVRNGVGHGIAVSNLAQVRIHDSQLINHAWRAVYATGTGLALDHTEVIMYAESQYNLVEGNGSGGLHFRRQAHGELSYVEVLANEYHGIILTSGAKAVLDQLVIDGNTGHGIDAADQGTAAEVSNTVIQNNRRGSTNASGGAVINQGTGNRFE